MVTRLNELLYNRGINIRSIYFKGVKTTFFMQFRHKPGLIVENVLERIISIRTWFPSIGVMWSRLGIVIGTFGNCRHVDICWSVPACVTVKLVCAIVVAVGMGWLEKKTQVLEIEFLNTFRGEVSKFFHFLLLCYKKCCKLHYLHKRVVSMTTI